MSNSVVQYFVTNSEKELIEEIQAIGFGELYNVSYKAGENYGLLAIPSSFMTLLRLLKDGTRFDAVVIQDSVPTVGKLEGKTESGRRYVQKVKF